MNNFSNNLKLKEEKESNEISYCTFKPTINNEFVCKSKILDQDNRKDRFKKLHEMGTKNLTNKKDKTQEEIEGEKNLLECTFKPNISTHESSKDVGFANDIYKEKSYELLYSRLNTGRIERIIKDSIHHRGEFPSEINEYRKLIINI